MAVKGETHLQLAVDSMEDEPSEKGTELRVKHRLHHLDWLRLIMVVFVVYAHTAKSGPTSGGFEAWLVDDRTLFDHRDYADLFQHLADEGKNGPIAGQCAPTHDSTARRPPRVVGPSSLAVRWISIARQWTLPLLFWVSGAAVACAYRGGAPRGLPKLVGFTALGMAFNAALWFLGPMDSTCYIGNEDCDGRGLVFNFTMVPFAGAGFAILYQMWYTVMLMAFILLNWPFFAVTYGSLPRVSALCLQWGMVMVLYAVLLFFQYGWEVPRFVFSLLGILEFAFLSLVPLVSPDIEGCKQPRWLPVRAVQYLMALVSIAQFGAMPFAREMDSIGAAYILYLVVGFNRFFNLGFIMTGSQLWDDKHKAEPLLSRVWPLALVLFVMVAPSTNWDVAGVLTYPYFLHISDRVLYVSGATCLVFLLDRCSRSMHCDALPGFLSQACAVLYLFHPVLITVQLHFGMRSVVRIWLTCVAVALAIAAVLEWPPALASRDSPEGFTSDEDVRE